MTNLTKFSTVLVGAGALLGILAAPVVGHADTKDSTVTASVSQDPHHGSLSLKQVPNFTFQSHIVNDGKAAGTASQNLTVDDETDSASGWNLSAKLNTFSADKADAMFKLTGSYIGLLPTLAGDNSKVGAAPVVRNDAPTIISGANTATNIASAESASQHKGTNGTSDGIGEGIGQWNIAFNPTLYATLPMISATYSSTITWTLTSGPTSDVAATPTK